MTENETRPTCATCSMFRPDPEPMAYPTGGNGWCVLERIADKSPKRERDTNWCERHKGASS